MAQTIIFYPIDFALDPETQSYAIDMQSPAMIQGDDFAM